MALGKTHNELAKEGDPLAETRLDKFGRIVIPRETRARLGLGPGAVLEIDDSSDALVLRLAEDAPPVRKKNGVLVYTGAVAGDLDPVRADREERLRRLLPAARR
jgi:AbrB family looped-hinge helix DNA binding protein